MRAAYGRIVCGLCYLLEFFLVIANNEYLDTKVGSTSVRGALTGLRITLKDI